MDRFLKIVIVLLLLYCPYTGFTQHFYSPQSKYSEKDLEIIYLVLALQDAESDEAAVILNRLEESWSDGYIPILVDLLYFGQENEVLNPVVDFLEKKTGQTFGLNALEWLDWIWSKEQKLMPFHDQWMATIYKTIDPKFEEYFLGQLSTATIRLDEVSARI